MKKLTKSDRHAFDGICEKIRTIMHIEHWEYEYIFESEDDEDKTFAENRCYANGQRICIAIFPRFWKKDADYQLRTLLHEHIHAVHNPLDQVIGKAIDRAHEADTNLMRSMIYKANEIVTDHLASVFFDLLKDTL